MYQQEKLKALKQFIRRHGDTQDSLAKALGMHKSTFNYKLNEKDGRAFTTREMQAICEHYKIPTVQRSALFFG